MPTFDGKSEKFELFEDLFQTSLKIHNQLTEEDKIYYFHSLLRGDALHTFKNISGRNRENLTEIQLFRQSEKLAMKFVQTFTQLVALVMLFSYQSAAGPRSKKENSAFFLKVYFASSPAFPSVSPSANMIFHSFSWIKDSASRSGSVPEKLSMARLE